MCPSILIYPKAPPLIGISYCLVIILVAVGGPYQQSFRSTQASVPTLASHVRRTVVENNIPMGAILVDITRQVHTDTNSISICDKAEDGRNA